jgi:hypothetical protein
LIQKIDLKPIVAESWPENLRFQKFGLKNVDLEIWPENLRLSKLD